VNRATAEPLRVVVVGAGIAGLATAYFLQRDADRPVEVTVLEAGQRIGGKLWTVEVEGLPVEAGADSFVVRKPWAVDLCTELGLEQEVVIPGTMGAFVWTRGELIPFPDRSPFGIPSDVGDLLRWPGLSRGPKVRALLDLLRPVPKGEDDEALGGLLRRRFGPELSRVLVEPLLAGLHAGDPERMSLLATFPELREWERKHGSLLRASKVATKAAGEERGRKPLFASVWGGLSRMTSVLAERLGPDAVRLDAPVAAIEPGTSGPNGGPVRASGRGGYLVHAAGETFPADAVVLATPAFESARLLSPVNSVAAEDLSAIPYASTAAVVLVYREGTEDLLPDGTGFVVPQGDGTITACTWISRKWPADAYGDRAVVRCFVGRSGDERALSLSDEELVERVAAEVDAAVGMGTAPEASRVVRWNRAMPQYEVGHLDRVGRIEEALARTPGLFVTGSAYRGVGIADCIRQARDTAARVREHGAAADQEAMTWTK
jgi:protoporphyrinogen/coproporphyrinogen III oxidase